MSLFKKSKIGNAIGTAHDPSARPLLRETRDLRNQTKALREDTKRIERETAEINRKLGR